MPHLCRITTIEDMRTLLVTFVLSGCGVVEVPDDPTPLTSISMVSPANAEAWASKVSLAAETWNTWCPGSFVVTSGGGREVREYTFELWPHSQEIVGQFNPGGSIDVRGDRTDDRVLRTILHELGHGLGLDHVDGRPSIMNRSAGPEITLEDAVLVCGVTPPR